jgi:hypothetical protein
MQFASKIFLFFSVLGFIFSSCKKDDNDPAPTTSTSPTITGFLPALAASEDTVVLTGTNFSTVSAVSFGGTAAKSFVVLSSTSIKAVVGAGTSGAVSVTSSSGTASKEGFTFSSSPLGSGTIGLEFDHIIGAQDLNLGTWYVNPNGDSVKFSTLKYFVSNIRLGKADGTFYTVPKEESYFIVNQDSAASKKVKIGNVPSGDYSTIEFILGVDSIKNRAPLGELTGALSTTGAAKGMNWNWNAGFIFFKMEGESPKVSGMTAPMFMYHIGLYGYTGGSATHAINNLKTISLSKSGQILKVRNSKEVEAHLKLDLAKVWKSDTYTINVATDPMIMVSPKSSDVAKNYSQAFSLDHVHND